MVNIDLHPLHEQYNVIPPCFYSMVSGVLYKNKINKQTHVNMQILKHI